jgi:RimJ/RimL family protein N-acetyltransferase
MNVLETKRLILRPVKNEDLNILSKWRNTDDFLEFVSSRKNIKCNLQFMIYLKKDDEPVGIVYTFSYNKLDGYMFLNVFIGKEYRQMGYGAEACIMTICYLFDSFPIYKIYCDALSSNIQSILMMRGAGLEQEALLKGHRLYNGVRYDVVRFAVHQHNLGFIRKLQRRFQNR